MNWKKPIEVRKGLDQAVDEGHIFQSAREEVCEVRKGIHFRTVPHLQEGR